MELSLQNIYLSMNKKAIINDVSLIVKPGTFVGIIGPNGSGKSSLLRTIYRTAKATSGTIFFNKQELKTIKLCESAQFLGVVGQFNETHLDVTVLDMILMGRTPHKKPFANDTLLDYDIARSAAEKVGMKEYLQQRFSTLSGGEKQRIILARALAQQPKILLLDEPTNHLDIKYQLQLLSIVKSLGITVLAVLHDLNLAAMYCDEIHVLQEGCLVASGAPSEVLTPELVSQIYDIQCTIDTNPKTGCLSISYYPERQQQISS